MYVDGLPMLPEKSATVFESGKTVIVSVVTYPGYGMEYTVILIGYKTRPVFVPRRRF